MKYWEKFLQEATEDIKESLEKFAITGDCSFLRCAICPFERDCDYISKEEKVKKLQTEFK